MAERDVGCTESATGYSSLYSRHSRNHVESVSVEICSIMTRLGYGEEIRRWRVEKYRELDRVANAQNGDVILITAGSKAEGLTSWLESDIDCLHVMKEVLCVEAGISLHTIQDDMDVFRMDTHAYPGHCRLLRQRKKTRRGFGIISNALCDDGYGGVLLSSSLFVDGFSTSSDLQTLPGTQSLVVQHGRDGPHVVQHERAGPSIPVTIYGILHEDRVYSLRCQCPGIFQRWSTRPRHWPSPVIVQKVISLGAYVTPVGFKGSEFKHAEWRICFNTGETELVNNLHDTQAKLYVILKMILKDILKPNKKEITSYVLKNIIFWQAERNPQSHFQERSLVHWLHDGLKELRTAIAKTQLSYYMIPERNLMDACGLNNNQQSKWIADITDMMEEGPRVILRLEKIRKAIVASPEPMLWFIKKRMEMEILILEGMIRIMQCNNDKVYNAVEDDSDFDAKAERIVNIVEEVRQRMLQEGSSINDLLDIFKRILM